MKRMKLIVAALVVGALATGAAVAYATIPDGKGVIHGCRNNGSGVLRVIDSGSCSPAETPLDWVQSAAYEDYFVAPFQPPVEITAVSPAPRQHVLTLALPPGGWEVATTLEADKPSGDGILDCATFVGPGAVSSVLTASMGTDPGDVRHVTLSGTGTRGGDLPDAASAEIRCRQQAGATGANPSIVLAEISAFRVGAITSAPGS